MAALISPYVDYTYYKGTFKGSKIPEAKFDEFEVRAEGVLHFITFNRVKRLTDDQWTDDIKKAICSAVCAMAEAGFAESKKTPGVTSETIDGYSRSFGNTGGSGGACGIADSMEQSARWYLLHTGLLFKGRSRIYDR